MSWELSASRQLPRHIKRYLCVEYTNKFESVVCCNALWHYKGKDTAMIFYGFVHFTAILLVVFFFY